MFSPHPSHLPSRTKLTSAQISQFSRTSFQLHVHNTPHKHMVLFSSENYMKPYLKNQNSKLSCRPRSGKDLSEYLGTHIAHTLGNTWGTFLKSKRQRVQSLPHICFHKDSLEELSFRYYLSYAMMLTCSIIQKNCNQFKFWFFVCFLFFFFPKTATFTGTSQHHQENRFQQAKVWQWYPQKRKKR